VKKWKAILTIFVSLLLGVVLILIFVEHWRGERALNSKLKELAAKRERLDFNEFLPSKIARDQNAAVELVAVTNSLHDLSKLSEEAPPMMKLASPGFAISYWQRNSWPNGDKTNSWAEFGPKIAAAGPVLAQLQSVWSKPRYDDGFDYATGMVDFPSMPLLICSKQSAMLFSAAIADDLSRAKPEEALNHLCSLLAVVKDLGDQPLIISQLVRVACASYAFNATWEALHATDLTDAQLREMQTAWETNEFCTTMVKSLEMERALTLDYFRQIRGSRDLELKQLAEEEEITDAFRDAFNYNGLPTHGFILRDLHLPVWRIAWAAQDELRSLARWEPFIKGGRVAESNSWLDAKNFFPGFDPYSISYLPFPATTREKLGWYDRCRFLFSEQPFSINGVIILKVNKIETQRNMAITAIALKRYELRHGKKPETLSALIPEFLAAVPIDRMDGKPLRYHLNSDGTFKLYSVGVNGTDEGGDPQPEKSGVDSIHDLWQGKDALWPRQVEESNDSAGASRL